MTVSVIVSTYNRAFSLLLSVLSLARQEPLPDEVVVADDGSGEETAEVVARLRGGTPFPVLHAWQEDRGFRAAAARNNGVRASSGGYLVFVDGDVLAGKGFLAAHLKFAAPGTFLLGNAMRLSEERSASLTEEEVRRGAFEESSAGEEMARLAGAHRRNRRHAFLRRCHLCKSHKPKLVALNFSLFRTDFEAVNGFDESFVGWGQEDDDLGRRLMMAKKGPRSIVPFARAYHIYHPTIARGGWGGGPNAWRLLSKDVSAFCKDGLVKAGEEGRR